MTIAPGSFTAAARPAGSTRTPQRLGIHRKTGRIYWWGSAYALLLRKRGLLRGTFMAAERAKVGRWCTERKLTLTVHAVEATPHIHGKEANVHWRLLHAMDAFMDRYAPSYIVDIISGFRTYSQQLALWLAYLAGRGNPANPPGQSKHEATDGYKSARAVDAYIAGVAFWTWCDRHGKRDEAQARGLRQPHGGEPWHVELAGL